MLFFGVQNKKKLSSQYKLLPPYGASFESTIQTSAVLIHDFYIRQTQILNSFRQGRIKEIGGPG